ncbi:MAG: ATP-dependent helicase C-terminal domain-containing protein, partial [Spirochaetales bacterium]|nr:ATP-dependent helicase C-terminal domain-containing protein [Spirochaetales bacterium]
KLFPDTICINKDCKKKVDYSNPAKPIIKGRMQEFYGINKTISIAEGKLVAAVELLSPAMRPLQTTSDLAGFWKGSYSLIRAEMRGRYPKHYWPENPAEAKPSLATGKKRPD